MQKVVKWLHQGALVDAIFSASTEDGRLSAFTLLQAAAGFGQLEVVRELLERGASVDLPSGLGTNALMDAPESPCKHCRAGGVAWNMLCGRARGQGSGSPPRGEG